MVRQNALRRVWRDDGVRIDEAQDASGRRRSADVARGGAASARGRGEPHAGGIGKAADYGRGGILTSVIGDNDLDLLQSPGDASTLNELLTLVGAGRGVLPVGAQARRYYARPDVSYVPFSDAPPLQWGLIWRTDRASARTRAFARAAQDLLR